MPYHYWFLSFFFSGLYLLQLFADLNDVFKNKFLHKVDSDTVLVSQVFHTAKNTASRLGVAATPKADLILDNLSVDEHGNVAVDFKLQENIHTIRLNERIQRRGKTLFSFQSDNSFFVYIVMFPGFWHVGVSFILWQIYSFVLTYS